MELIDWLLPSHVLHLGTSYGVLSHHLVQSGSQECTIGNQKLWLKKVEWILGSQSTSFRIEGALVIKPDLETKTYQVIWSFRQVHRDLGSNGRTSIPAVTQANFWLYLVPPS